MVAHDRQKLAIGMRIATDLALENPREVHPSGRVVLDLAGYYAGVAAIAPVQIHHHAVPDHRTPLLAVDDRGDPATSLVTLTRVHESVWPLNVSMKSTLGAGRKLLKLVPLYFATES